MNKTAGLMYREGKVIYGSDAEDIHRMHQKFVSQLSHSVESKSKSEPILAKDDLKEKMTE
jgi:TATA-box binding protein (TBP) (component of TFIID and TFIIIB)